MTFQSNHAQILSTMQCLHVSPIEPNKAGTTRPRTNGMKETSSLQRNDCPGLITSQTWSSKPIKDSSCFLRHDLLEPRSPRKDSNRYTFFSWTPEFPCHCIDLDAKKDEKCSGIISLVRCHGYTQPPTDSN